MNLFKRYKTSNTLEVEKGVDLVFGQNARGENIVITIRRAGGSNKRFLLRRAASLEKVRAKRRAGNLDEAEAMAILIEDYVDEIVIGWSGVDDPEDKPLAFTRENCIWLFTELPELFDRIVGDSNDMQLFLAANLERDLGNSGASSSTD